MKRILVAPLALLLCFAANGQQPADANGRRYIEVSGSNEMEVTPDEIYLTITLQESRERPTIQKQEEELKQMVKDLGMDMSSLTLNSANADYSKVRMMKKEVQVAKSYQLKISGTDMLGKVYEKLDKMNAQDAYISRVDHSKILDLKKESRIAAIQAAKEKVTYILAAIGQQLGQPIQITEIENYVQNYISGYKGKDLMASNSATFMSQRSLDDDEIAFKKIKIKTSFLVRYEIANK